MDSARIVFAVLVLAALGWKEVNAATVLPARIQACVDTGACTTPLVVDPAIADTVSTYRDGVTDKYLFAYHLGPGSQDGEVPLAGTLWVSAPATFDLRDNLHTFDLYFDRVTPQPLNLWLGDSDGLDIQLGLSTSALLGGQGHLLFVDGGDSETNMATLGDGSQTSLFGFAQSFFPCAAETCVAEATFNLVGYRYVDSADVAALELTSSDRRGVIYAQRLDFTGFPSNLPRSQTYATVPVPGSLTLCMGAVCALLLRARRVVHPGSLATID